MFKISTLKGVIILPMVICAIISLANFFAGRTFLALSFLGLTMFGFIIAWPLFTEMEDKVVPIFMIFFSMFVFAGFFAVGFFYDFLRVGFSVEEAFLIAVGGGFVALAGLMMLNSGYK